MTVNWASLCWGHHLCLWNKLMDIIHLFSGRRVRVNWYIEKISSRVIYSDKQSSTRSPASETSQKRRSRGKLCADTKTCHIFKKHYTVPTSKKSILKSTGSTVTRPAALLPSVLTWWGGVDVRRPNSAPWLEQSCGHKSWWLAPSHQ